MPRMGSTVGCLPYLLDDAWSTGSVVSNWGEYALCFLCLLCGFCIKYGTPLSLYSSMRLRS
jgi:hypothetical protein